MSLRHRRPAVRNNWTDFNRSDPSVILLELFGYVADLLSYYADKSAAEAQLRTRRRYTLALGALVTLLLFWWRSTYDPDGD